MSKASSRSESKELTRQALLRAALKLLSRNSYDSISLRQVTKEAGISPTVFDRHFDDMEELGLELVEESFGSLHKMLREAAPIRRSSATRSTGPSRRSCSPHSRTRPTSASSPESATGACVRGRKAIRRQLQLFADELAIDLAAFPFVKDWTTDDRRMLASLIAEIMIHMTAELLDADPDETVEIIERSRKQMILANLAVPTWSEIAGPADLDALAREELGRG